MTSLYGTGTPPKAVEGLFTQTLQEFQLEILTVPPTFNITGNIKAFAGKDDVVSELLIREDTSTKKWGFVLSVLVEEFNAADFDPEATGLFDGLKLREGGVRISVPASLPATSFGNLAAIDTDAEVS